MKKFIEVTSVGGKTWSIRVDEIAFISKRESATEEEMLELNLKESPHNFCIVILIHSSRELWIKDSYEEVIQKIADLNDDGNE